MNYEKKYNKALARAMEELKVCGSQDCDAARQIFRFFPELKEDNDERIRKGLIKEVSRIFGNKLFDTDVTREEALDWLEKQESYTFEIKEGHWYKCVCDYILNGSDLMFKNDRLYYCRSNWRLNGEIDERNVKNIGVNGYKSFFRPATNQEIKDWLEKQEESEDKGKISDGYHTLNEIPFNTFNELYNYRMLYNAAFFNMLPKEIVHKSKRHHDGKECFGGGWFIVMANLPTGQISNHYELKDWDLFQIPEKEVADEWDGHTPQEAAERLHKYLLEKQVEQKQAWEPDEAQLIVIKDLIEDKNTSKVNKIILRGMFDEFKQCFEL